MTEFQVGVPCGVGATIISAIGDVSVPAAIVLIVIGAVAATLVHWYSRE